MAHFHIPKPLHGWREFAGEVGIIVLGVLIALGFEQIAQAIHSRQLAAETRRVVQEELETNLAALALRRSAEPCIARRLTEIRSIVQQWALTNTFRAPLWIAQTPGTGVSFARYDAAVAAGRMALLPNEEQFQIGSIVERVRSFYDTQTRENEPWSKLRLLQEGPRFLTMNDRPMILEALQTASMLDYQARLRIRQALPEAQEFGYRPDMRRFGKVAPAIWKSGRYTPSICVDINTPPAQANEQSGQVVPLPE